MKDCIRIILVVCVAVALTAAGCKGREAPPPQGEQQPVSAESAPQASPAAEQDLAVRVARSEGTPTEEPIQTMESGLRYIDVKVGTGKSPQKGQKVTVHYSGWLTNGHKFDSSYDRNEPFTFTLGAGQVIKGWELGVATMKPGGVRKLIIPSDLGYGAQGATGAIPPYATLIFEVELLKVE